MIMKISAPLSLAFLNSYDAKTVISFTKVRKLVRSEQFDLYILNNILQNGTTIDPYREI